MSNLKEKLTKVEQQQLLSLQFWHSVMDLVGLLHVE